MKMKVWTILAATTISTSVMADQPAVAPAAASNAAPAEMQPAIVPAPVTAPAIEAPVPAAKPAKKKSTTAKKAAPTTVLNTAPLVPGSAVVVANRVNVRGKAGLSGEVIGHLTNGEPVTVIEEVTLKNSGPSEPSAWAKINLPQTIRVWVHGSFIDQASSTVKATKLNLRGGPGENFSVLGQLHKGDAVKPIEAKGDWTQIEPPATAYAFVAAPYLKQEAAPAIVSNETVPPVEPAPTETATVADNQTVAPTMETPAEPTVATTDTNNLAAATGTNEMVAAEMPPVEEVPPPPRIVQREGLVRSTLSIQAPTKYELVSTENFKAINYLFTTATNLDLSRYKGLHIIVTGEEGLDERWKNTPVITIQQIRVLE
jgi:uncharacterized protein YgiM (DUF1202 family)